MTSSASPPPSPASVRRRRLLFALAAAALAALLSLVLLEAGLRLFNPLAVRERASWHFLLVEAMRPSPNPEKVWEHVPGYRRHLVGYAVAINSLGFRGEEISLQPPDRGFRVLAIGDSKTFGMSGEQEDAYPAQLQAMMREAHPDRPMEVVNAGVLGYTTLQEEALLRETLPRLRPDLVVLYWVSNDDMLTGSANPASQEEELRMLIGIRPATPFRRLIHLGYEIAPCSMALLRAATVGRRDGGASPHPFFFDPDANPEGWAANRRALERIIAFCREHETPIIIYSFGRQEALETLCREAGAPYLFSVEQAGPEHARRYAVAEVDPHFNREGNRVVAQTIFEAMQARPDLFP